jgi:hypothetical protein
MKKRMAAVRRSLDIDSELRAAISADIKAAPISRCQAEGSE